LWVVFVDVKYEELSVACSAGDDADAPVFVWAFIPVADGVGVAGGEGGPVFDAG